MHAPHRAAPQPNFVPVSFNSSRITHSSGVLSGAWMVTGLPFNVNATIAVALLEARNLAPQRPRTFNRRARLPQRSIASFQLPNAARGLKFARCS